MKDKSAWRLTLQALLHLAVSGVLTLLTASASVVAAEWITVSFRMRTIRDLLRDLVNRFGEPTLMVSLGFVLFLFYFILLQMLSYRYFDRVNKALRQMAEGELPFDHKVQVRRRSPFRHTAIHINQLAGRLHQALEDERRAEQTKNELITNVSHDLRTPLTSILGYLGLIEQDRYRDEVELRHYVQIAYTKSQRLNVLIQDLFDYTRMHNEKQTFNLISINVVEMLGELLIQFDIQLKNADMTGGLTASDPKIVIKADPAKIVRVFENLISNAIAYGREGKRIDIRVLRNEDQAIIEIINYGEPISSMDLPYIFDRFYRADKSRTEWSGGSGLGLAIVKNIVELHDGTITASSDAAYTSFRVVLPLNR